MQSQNTTATTTRYIRSFTNPHRFYVVALNPRGFWECDCPAAQFNRRAPCKHVKAVAKTGAGLVAKPKAERPSLRHRPLSEAGRAFASALEV